MLDRPVVLVAPDKFKGTLSAAEAARAMELGVQDVLATATVRRYPTADGGEGTVDAFVAAGAATTFVEVSGPITGLVEARVAVLGDVAVVEAADACGLHLCEGTRSSALDAHTWGVGELLLHALDTGAATIIVGLGGSGSTDGGSGMARALGARVAGADDPPPLGGRALAGLRGIDVSRLDPRVGSARVIVASDVMNPLTGQSGAAYVFGPQKGAGDAEIALLDGALSSWASVLRRDLGRDIEQLPGAGAAGGLGGAFVALCDAEMTSGAEILIAVTGMRDGLGDADLVITGEGSIDHQTLQGKAPAAVARAARDQGVPVIALAGRATLTPDEARECGFDMLQSMLDAVGLKAAMDRPAEALRSVTRESVAAWATSRLGGS